MYILHIPLLWWFSQYTTYRYGSAAPGWIGFTFVAIVIGISIAAYEYVEAPANLWIRDWSAGRLQARPPRALRAAA
jgi:peptidoglycan/LPS O-acetylase OafA/YrhL